MYSFFGGISFIMQRRYNRKANPHNNIQLIALMNKQYVCGCGRVYGSYPAFSTHRKTKHQNQTIPGTKIPLQEKAKRGRPSYDFKKVPKPETHEKNTFEGLTIIQYGLLDLEEKYKGRIISEPTADNDYQLPQQFLELQSEKYPIILGMIRFTKLITNHMRYMVAVDCVSFITKLINHGEQTSLLDSIQVYNSFFKNNSQLFKKEVLGMEFYIQICVIMAKWLQISGYSSQSLRIRQKSSYEA